MSISVQDIQFLCHFSDWYGRNNRTCGQKSIRCFPSCKSTGHVERGFCGSHLTVQFRMQSPAALWFLEKRKLLFFAEIRRSMSQGISSSRDKISIDGLLNNSRHRNSKSKNPLFHGEVTVIDYDPDGVIVRVQFNREQLSWNYGWKSNRWNQDSHVVDIFCVLCEEDVEPAIAFSFCSTEFCLSCTHQTPNPRSLPIVSASDSLRAVGFLFQLKRIECVA